MNFCILIKKYPKLKKQIENLEEGWWWKHPLRNNESIDPNKDSKILFELNGEYPAKENGKNIIIKLQKFSSYCLPSTQKFSLFLRNCA
jgi:hypothetical protein